MSTKTTLARTIPRPSEGVTLPTPWTTDERLRQIEALGLRVAGYIQFMTQVGTLGGTSDEAKDRAVTAFFERLTALEKQLGRIQEELKLG